MILREINDLVLNKIPSISKDDSETRLTSISYINFAISALWRASKWEFRKKVGQLTLEPNYTTGTCNIVKFDGTNYSTAVTVSLSSPLPFNVRGRYFKPSGSSSNYKIISGNAGESTLVLISPITDGSGSSLNFSIWKRFYYAVSEADILPDLRRWDGGGSLKFTPSSKISANATVLDYSGAPSDYSVFGSDEYDDVSYETGTVSASIHSNVITGNGTSFLGNVGCGDSFEVNKIKYFVKRVDSDTSLVLYNYVKDEIISGSAYKIKKQSPIGLTFFPSNDEYRTIDYEYLSKPYDLVNEDYDGIYIGRDYIEAIILNAESMWLEHKDYSKYLSVVNLYQAKMNALKSRSTQVDPRYLQFEPLIDSCLPGRE